MPIKTKADSARLESLELQPKVGFLSLKTYENLRKVRFVCYSAFKRCFDFVVSSVMIIALSPLFLVVAVLIKLDSPGPILFRQKRTGRGGREFEILKFRSMSLDNDMFDMSCGDQITRIGGVIRRTSIDELPQIINVWLGQMSFIGPRPWVPEYFANMNEYERQRCNVRPGITGLAAAKGRNGLTIFEKISYDLEYVENYSLSMDIKVILLTVYTVVRGADVDAGKSGIHDDITVLTNRTRGHKIVLLGGE